LVAAGWIDRVVRERIDAGLRRELVARLVEAAGVLAPLAAAQRPELRPSWAEAARDALAPIGGGTTRWEGLIAHVALAWIGACAFDTDVLWTPGARADADLLLQLTGHQPDPLAGALVEAWAKAGLRFTWGSNEAPAWTVARAHACADFEHEALSAAACVIEHLNAARSPVALIANDRLLTRRVNALLLGAGVRVRDEAGWKLSTTQAAAAFMALLRAAAPRASSDDVLDWLKLAPAFDAGMVHRTELALRRLGVSVWSAVPPEHRPDGVDDLLGALHAPRPLVHWLRDVDAALQASGQRCVLEADAAGQQLLTLLRLGNAAHELDGLGETAGEGAQRRWSLARFSAWVREVLEGAGFQPESEGAPQVVVLPLAQRMGRGFAAVVAPGCDERHLPVSPEPAGTWSPEQRATLGLPDREALRMAQASAWVSLFDGTPLDVLWRHQDGGDVRLPSPLVEALSIEHGAPALATRTIAAQGTPSPRPSAPGLMPERLSASAYEDLRRCPYRFFGLRQLRLSEADELDTEADARDLGNWLHNVLRAFHEQRRDVRPGEAADRAALDALAEAEAGRMGLTQEAGAAGFLPYRAQWPALREAYLRWLQAHEAVGFHFIEAEAAHQTQAGRWTLHGRLDRIDNGPDQQPLLIDYKTENRQKTRERVKLPFEDTQIAFYAALLGAPAMRAGYLSLTDGRSGGDDAALLVEQTDLLAARDALLEGVASDLDRIAAGAPMPALGEGSTCEHCAARGLCRKDFLP
jgi:ATP-dependent helicase/nuclease subunit B